MGYAQGVQYVYNGVSNIIITVASHTPQAGYVIGTAIAGLVQEKVDINYGSYWVFGISLAIFGLIAIGIGDRKQRTLEERAPLLPEPITM
jgi:predicted MFS family arabinose efflux permease